jgi:hypothetical protein
VKVICRPTTRHIYSTRGHFPARVRDIDDITITARCACCGALGQWGIELLDYHSEDGLILTCDPCAALHDLRATTQK